MKAVRISVGVIKWLCIFLIFIISFYFISYPIQQAFEMISRFKAIGGLPNEAMQKYITALEDVVTASEGYTRLIIVLVSVLFPTMVFELVERKINSR